MMTRYKTQLLGLTILSALVGLSVAPPARAQEQRPYPPRGEMDSVPLSVEQRSRLESLVMAPRDPKLRKKITDQLCAPIVKRAESVNETVKPVLSVVENSGATEIVFSRPAADSQTGPEQFSFLVEFFANQVLLRHSTPRFASESIGVAVPYPLDYTRGVWTEGKLGTDMLVLIPSTKNCAAQAVVLCPRAYQHPDKLVQSQFVPTAARWFYTAKADGLAAATISAPQGSEAGRVMASIQGNAHVTLPTQWSAIGNDARNPAATVKYSNRGPEVKTPPPFIRATLPHVITLQSRLDFGTQTAVLRTATRTTTVEISELPVRSLNSVQVGHSLFSVEDGMCYLIAQSSSTML